MINFLTNFICKTKDKNLIQDILRQLSLLKKQEEENIKVAKLDKI